MKVNKFLEITLTKSLIGRFYRHKLCALGLGLYKINQTVKVLNTPENRGMADKIYYMTKIRVFSNN